MAQQIRKRFQRAIGYVANNKESEQLSRGMVYRELGIRLKGQLAVTAANNTAAKTKRGDEFAVIRRLDIIANNTDTLRSIKGPDLWWLNYFLFGTTPEVSSAIGDGATDNPEFDTILRLPFWMPRSIRPMDTALDARELSDLKVEIVWGTHTDINADATAFTVSPTVEISSLESFGVKGPFSQFRMFPIEKSITASNPQFTIDLAVGKMYRGFLLAFENAAADSGAVLNNFKWISGTTVFADQKAKELHEEYITRHGLPRNPTRRGTANDVAGLYLYDHVTDGYMSEAVDALGFSELQLELDVAKPAGDTKVTVYPMQLIPVRGGNNG